MVQLELLKQNFPLSPEWGPIEVLRTTCAISGIDVELVGLWSESSKWREVITGSAGAIGPAPFDRAYFELIERASVVEMERDRDRLWATKDIAGRENGSTSTDRLVPMSLAPDEWRYARSSGVAAGRTWYEACRRAEWELAERDRVLRSWRGEEKPTRAHVPRAVIPAAFNEYYSFEACLFNAMGESEISVAGIFGFPKQRTAPLVYGFGARISADAALAAAGVECIQRLGFLWGETIDDNEPEFSPSPDFHQNFFLRPSTHHLLRDWLAGEHRVMARSNRRPGCNGESARRFVDITPFQLSTKVFVAKAIPDGELPLVFGRPPPNSLVEASRKFLVHPIV